MNYKLKLTSIALLALVISISGCGLNNAKTPADKRQYILDMKSETLRELYRVKPHARGVIRKAAGYAVFSSANVNVVLASFGGGYGVATDNRNGRNTYMRMGEVGLGLGLGVKDFRVIFVFHTRRTMNQFVNKGWNFGAHADAAAKASDKGGSYSGEALIGSMTIYHLTKSGLALQATLKGTKFWKDNSLNN